MDAQAICGLLIDFTQTKKGTHCPKIVVPQKQPENNLFIY